MRVVYDEAMDSYKQEIVIELPSNTIEDMEANGEKIEKWINAFLV
jgi:adenylate kinase